MIETAAFIKAAAVVFTDAERLELIDYIAANPFAGDEIRGSGGVCKVRFATGNRGKSGGARVVYFAYDADAPIVLLTCYGKNVRANISQAEVNACAKPTAALKAHYRKTD